MSKKTSLTYQINSAINACFCPGQSKRAYKYDHHMKTDYKIFSYAEKDAMHEIGKNLAKYVHKKFGINYVRDIKQEHIQDWLDNKALTSSQNTLNRYDSAIRKLEQICVKHFGSGNNPETHFKWNTDKIIIPESQSSVSYKKTLSMDFNTSRKLIDYFKSDNKKSDVWRSVILSSYAGLRVEETSKLRVERIHIEPSKHGEYGYIEIRKGDGSKGNRPRIIPITNKTTADMLLSVIADRENGEYIVRNSKSPHSPLKQGSITKALERALFDLKLTHYKGNLNHAMRKNWAQNMYDEYRKSHTKEETIRYVNTILGHGEQRSIAELAHYCNNIH